jgi:YD repeat-containing protein
MAAAVCGQTALVYNSDTVHVEPIVGVTVSPGAVPQPPAPPSPPAPAAADATSVSRYSYDAANRLFAIRDEPGTVTTYVYDGRGRPATGR